VTDGMKMLNDHDRMRSDVERMLREQLYRLDEAYQKARAPIIQRLVEIESLRPPAPFLVDVSALGILDKPNV